MEFFSEVFKQVDTAELEAFLITLTQKFSAINLKDMNTDWITQMYQLMVPFINMFFGFFR